MSPRAAREPVPVDVLDGLVQVSFAVMALLSRVAAEHDLSLTQLRALAILRDREPTMAELARSLGLEPSSASGLVERAVTRGLVTRVSSAEDARVVRVGLTPQAQRLGRVVDVQVAALIAPMTRTLTPAERKRLGLLLQRVLEP